MRSKHSISLALCILASGFASSGHASVIVFEATGTTPADIVPTRDAFRTAVGGGTTAGPNGDFGGLRREINWDGVPEAFSDPNDLPGNFFNVNSPRGVVFTTPGAGFRVSANAGNSTGTSVLFGFPSDLQTFSSQKLFGTVGSHITDIHFFVPGTTTPATTSAFGVVFVDLEDNTDAVNTTLDFFDVNDNVLFSRRALATPNQGLSFLGGVADAGEQIARVRITTPLNFLSVNGGRDNEVIDFVIMDDFLYATPVPEPATSALVGLALLLPMVGRRLGHQPAK